MNSELITVSTDAPLANAVGGALGKQVHVATVEQYADGELSVRIKNPDQFAGKTVFLLQSPGSQVHTMLFAVSFVAHELKNSGARAVIGVIPYFGYSRQESSQIAGKPGNAAVVAQVLQAAGIDAVVSVELHTPMLKKLFSIPVHSLSVSEQIAAHIQTRYPVLKGVCLVAPDEGARQRVAHIAQLLGLEYLVFKKERYGADTTRILSVHDDGTCTGHTAIIIDDIIDTAGTALAVCEQLHSLGFKNIYGYFVHPVLAADAVKKIEASSFKKIFVSNTLSMPAHKQSNKIEIFDIHKVIVDSIKHLARVADADQKY